MCDNWVCKGAHARTIYCCLQACIRLLLWPGYVRPARYAEVWGAGGRAQGHSARVCALAASPVSQVLASAEEGPSALIRLWDVPSGLCLSLLHGELRKRGLAAPVLSFVPQGIPLLAPGWAS